MPKSMMRTFPLYETSTLCGETSRWTTPSGAPSSSVASCAPWSPLAIRDRARPSRPHGGARGSCIPRACSPARAPTPGRSYLSSSFDDERAANELALAVGLRVGEVQLAVVPLHFAARHLAPRQAA